MISYEWRGSLNLRHYHLTGSDLLCVKRLDLWENKEDRHTHLPLTERILCSFLNYSRYPLMWPSRISCSRAGCSPFSSPQPSRPAAAPSDRNRLPGCIAATHAHWPICRAKSVWCGFTSPSVGSDVQSPPVRAALLPKRIARSRKLDEVMFYGIPRGSTASSDLDLAID